MARKKTKKSSRGNTKIRAEDKYKALNALLMLVILFFVLFFIARMPKHERTSMAKPSAVTQIAKAPEPPVPIAPPAISPVAQAPKFTTAPGPILVAPKPAEPPKKPITVSAPKPPAAQKTPTVAAKTPAPAPKPIAATAKKSVNFAKTKILPLRTAAAIAPAPRPAAPSIPKPPPVKIKPQETALPPAVKIPGPQVQLKGKIAIVLDDWGYRAGSPGMLNARLYPVTAAVIPNLTHTRSVIEQLHENGYEIILHLPMEPTDKINLEPDTITIDLNEGQIRKIVDQDLSEISYAKGINNHMGSRATSDTRTMVPVFKELRRKHLYFLDSYTSSDSVCEDLAQKLKVSFIKRDVFIDNESDPEYIRGQIAKLKSLASLRGWAIGIGHDRKSTLEVLQEELPKIRNEGYELVYVSELAK
jgi:polysaccharide deacetylase 2 family uncharacterized protein YibQ